MNYLLLNLKYVCLSLSLLFIFSFYSCSDSDKKSVYDPSIPIVVESFSPEAGGVGSKLIIRGKNFGSDASIIKVIIENEENREAKVISVNDTRIYAIIPARAGSGVVSVTIGTDDNAQTAKSDEDFDYEFRRNVSTLTGGSSTIAIKDGSFAEALFEQPFWLEQDAEGFVYVLEEVPKALRMLDLLAEEVSTPWVGTKVNRTLCMQFCPTRDTLFIGIEGGSGSSIHAVSSVVLMRANGFSREKVFSMRGGSNGIAVNPIDREVFFNDYWTGEIYRWDRVNSVPVLMRKVTPNHSDFTFCWSHDGSALFYIVRNGADAGYIGKCEYDFTTKTLGEPVVWVGQKNSTGFSDGQGEEARFYQPNQMIAGPDGDYYVADRHNHCIRRITANGVVSTIAGKPQDPGFTEGDPLKDAQFNEPTGLAISDDGSTIFVADRGNRRICKIVVE